jgi:hypothetical protein
MPRTSAGVKALTLVAGLASLATLLTSSKGSASPADDCLQDNLAGQKAHRTGGLLEARRRLSSCTSSACPRVLRSDCQGELDRVNQDMPSIVVSAFDGAAEITAVRLSVDGTATADHLDGLAMDLDPGEHRVEVTASDGRSAADSVVLHVGEKARNVALHLPEAHPVAPVLPPPVPSETGRGIPAGTWIAGALAVVAGGSFAYFGLTGRGQENKLDQCAPNCNRPDVDTMRHEYLAADISLGVSVLALGAAAIFYFAQGHEAPVTVQPATGSGLFQVRFQ